MSEQHPRRDNRRHFATVDDLVAEIAERFTSIPWALGKPEVQVDGEKITLAGYWRFRQSKLEYDQAWGDFKTTVEALKSARIWTDYSDNLTPKDGQGRWEVVVWREHPDAG